MANEECSGGQHRSGKAIRRALVRGQAVSRDASARGRGPARQSEPLELLPGLPPTRELQQLARRLAEATAAATARVKEALGASAA